YTVHTPLSSREPLALFVRARQVLLDADGQRAVPVLLVAGGRGSVRKKHGNFAESRLRLAPDRTSNEGGNHRRDHQLDDEMLAGGGGVHGGVHARAPET